jgi:homoaconitate hydratase
MLTLTAVVAASAAAGKIISPASFLASKPILQNQEPIITVQIPTEDASAPTAASDAPKSEPVPGFPAEHKGELLFCDTDNLDTDGIYPGAYTYQDDITPDEMAKVAMKNYDPTFSHIVKQVHSHSLQICL